MELRTFRMKLYTIIYSVCQLVSLIQLKGVEKDATITAKKLLFCFKFFTLLVIRNERSIRGKTAEKSRYATFTCSEIFLSNFFFILNLKAIEYVRNIFSTFQLQQYHHILEMKERKCRQKFHTKNKIENRFPALNINQKNNNAQKTKYTKGVCYIHIAHVILCINKVCCFCCKQLALKIHNI